MPPAPPPSPELARQFARCWPWLAAALLAGDDRDLSRDQVWDQVAARTATLWPGERGALVTELTVRDGARFVHVWLGGGELEALLALRPGVEAWARAQGAEFASINGRRGWDRVFRPFGYARHGGELVKIL